MQKPLIRKLGTIDCDIVETTPIVFRNRLYRFEYIRSADPRTGRRRYYANDTDDSYFRFIDWETGAATPSFGHGWHLGSAFVEGETVYVFGVDRWGGNRMRRFRSLDLRTWESAPIPQREDFAIFNNSVCRNAAGRYILLVELSKPKELVGVPFTPRFLESTDLLSWRMLPEECVFGREFYTGGHFLAFEGEHYYMTYLHALPGPAYETRIVRSRDLANWETSPLNPFMTFSDEDKVLADPRLPETQRARIAAAVNVNSSDHEFCEFRGRTVMTYSWGDQRGAEFLAEAVYDGPRKAVLEGFFPAGAAGRPASNATDAGSGARVA
jgi:hypothetical protein